MNNEQIATPPDTQNLIAQDAAEHWLSYLYSGLADEPGKYAFQQWLHACQENQDAFQQAEQLWQDLGFALLQNPQDPILSMDPEPAANDELFSAKPKWLIGIAASLMLGFTLLLTNYTWQPSVSTAQYATTTGEIKTLTLSDKSTVTLAANSLLNVTFSDDERQLRLLRGRAYFEVSPDKDRPFIVSAQETSATAVGTAFDVNNTHNAVFIAVTHGIVDVKSHRTFQQSAPINYQQLTAGQRIESVKNGQLMPKTHFDLTTELAWREGRLVYEGEKLSVITEEINRYRTQKIRLVSQALQNKRITLSIPSNETDLLIGAIKETDSVKVIKTPTEVVISQIK